MNEQYDRFGIIIDGTSTRTIEALRLALRYLVADAAILDEDDGALPELDAAIDEISGTVHEIETNSTVL